jgi:parvulin-like peptidyl-prolyl isomerase
VKEESMKRVEKIALCATVVMVVSSFLGCSDGNDAEHSSAEGAEISEHAADEVKQATSQSGAGEMPAEVSAAHILIMYKGSARAPAKVTRTKEEALELAKSIAEKAKAKDADFAALAKEYSDGPTAPRGGNLGNFAPSAMVKPFTDALLKLEIGGVSDVVETQFGYHIIRRQEVKAIPKASAKHILVMYQGSMRAPANITRSKEEAYARCLEALERVRAGEKFEDIARDYSDGPTGRDGGDLGEFSQGQMAPAFDEATFACKVGSVTEIVETPFGYHIIYRYN